MEYTPKMFWNNFDKILKEKKVKLTDLFEYRSSDYVRISTAKHRNAFLRLDDIITLCSLLNVSLDKLVFGVEREMDQHIDELEEAFLKEKDLLLSITRLINNNSK